MISHHDLLLENTRYCLKKSKIKKVTDMTLLVDNIIKNNPYSLRKDKNGFFMWREQACINIPILYLSSIYLYKYAESIGCNIFLFATRDCCNWYRIFKKMFPNTKSHYFDCSRVMFKSGADNKNIYYKQYVKSLIGDDMSKVMFIDLHGTGRRMFYYFEKRFFTVPHCFILSASANSYDKMTFSLTKKYINQNKATVLMFGIPGKHIEMLNYDNQGSLINYTKKGPVRDDPEYKLKMIKPYYDCIEYAIKNIETIDCNLLYEFDMKYLYKVIKSLFYIVKYNYPVVYLNFDHVNYHSGNNLINKDLLKNNKTTH